MRHFCNFLGYLLILFLLATCTPKKGGSITDSSRQGTCRSPNSAKKDQAISNDLEEVEKEEPIWNNKQEKEALHNKGAKMVQNLSFQEIDAKLQDLVSPGKRTLFQRMNPFNRYKKKRAKAIAAILLLSPNIKDETIKKVLLYAVESKKTPIARLILENPNYEITKETARGVFLRAAKNNKIRIVQLILKKASDKIDEQTFKDALLSVIENNKAKIIKLILNQQSTISQATAVKEVLLKAAEQNKTNSIKAILDNTPHDIDLQTAQTVFLRATQKKNITIIAWVLKNSRGNINSATINDGLGHVLNTKKSKTSSYKNQSIKLILNAAQKGEIKSEIARKVLHYAISNNSSKIAALILQKASDEISARTVYEALCKTVNKNQLQIATLIFNKLSDKISREMTKDILSQAIKRNSSKVVILTLQRVSDDKIDQAMAQTTFFYAVDQAKPKVVTLILEKAPNAISNDEQYEAIKQAVKHKKSSLTKALCLQGNMYHCFTKAAQDNEIKVIEKILKYAKSKIDTTTLSKTLQRAVNEPNGARALAILKGVKKGDISLQVVQEAKTKAEQAYLSAYKEALLKELERL